MGVRFCEQHHKPVRRGKMDICDRRLPNLYGCGMQLNHDAGFPKKKHGKKPFELNPLRPLASGGFCFERHPKPQQ